MKVHLGTKPALTVHRRILRKSKLVYLLVGPCATKYQDGKSRIVYIGMTVKGTRRIATSVAHRAEDVLVTRGFRKLDAFIVSCGARPGLRSWEYLEQALLAEFRAYYHELPRCNKQGKKLRWNDKLDRCFKRRTIESILKQFDG
jgi:hypothetical protein